MSKNFKLRLVLVCVGILCLGFTLVFLVSRLSPSYWAYSGVMMEPFTNAVFGRPFETQVIKSIPLVHQLKVAPGFRTGAAAMSWSTNKVFSGAGAPVSAEIRIMVLGSSPQEAQSAANDAATQLCVIVQRQYGGRTHVIQRANITGRWLFPYELKLRVVRLSERLFKR